MKKRTEKVTVTEEFLRNRCIRGCPYVSGWQVAGVGKRVQKRFQSIRCGHEKGRNCHATFASKGIAGVFAVLAIGRYNNRAQEYSADLAQGGLEIHGSLLFKATLMEPTGSGSPFRGLN